MRMFVVNVDSEGRPSIYVIKEAWTATSWPRTIVLVPYSFAWTTCWWLANEEELLFPNKEFDDQCLDWLDH